MAVAINAADRSLSFVIRFFSIGYEEPMGFGPSFS
jgi:hypothetical protein